MTRRVLQRRAKISIHISNSHGFASSRSRASWAFSVLPLLEGRRSAERRALVVQKAPFGRSVAATSSSLGPCFRQPARDQLADPGRFPRPSPAPVQPLKAEPRSGPGRLPKAPRVCVCETQPRAPHRPSGCPSGQLSLCPTSGSPLEAPLTGQDTIRISEGQRGWIGIHSQVRERQFVGRISGPGR